MKTKLQLFTLTLCLVLFGFINMVKAGTLYYLKSGGNPTVLNNWATGTNGISGTHPGAFSNGDTYYLNQNNVSVTLVGTWNLAPATIVYVGKHGGSSSGTSFTVNSGAIISGGILNTETGTSFTVKGDISGVSDLSTMLGTVTYCAGIAQSIIGASYQNLTVSGGTTGTLLSGPASVSGALILSSVSDILILNGNELDINGTFSGSGTFTGDTLGSALLVGMSNTNLSLNFTSAAAALLSNLTIGTSAVSTCTVTLTSNLIVSGGGNGSAFDMTGGGAGTTIGGSINLNGHTLTLGLDCYVTFGSSTNIVTGSKTSSLVINTDSLITNSLFLDQTTAGSTNALSSLVLNSTGQTLTLSNALNVTDSICPTAGTIAGGGHVTLVADQAIVGHVGRIGFVGGSITGNITSQVYHNPPAGNTTNWILMGVAGVSTAAFSQWGAEFTMYCTTCPNGTDLGGGQSFASITSYDEASDSFPDNVVYTNNITVGKGYWVYMGTTNSGTASGPESIIVTGSPVQGAGTWSGLTHLGSTSDAGSNLISNPYPSPISWDKVIAANGGAGGAAFAAGLNTIYVWCPTLAGGVGDYATYQSIGGAPGSGITSAGYTPGSANIDDKLAAGQGFYVVTNGSANSINYSESAKVMSGSDSSFLMRKTHTNNAQATSAFAYFRINATAGVNSSSAVISFNPNGTTGIDPYDSRSMAWNNVVQISTTIMGKSYVINGLPDLTTNYSIPVKILSGTTTPYTISIDNLTSLPSGACLILHDNYGIMPDQDLRTGPFNVTVNDTETVARFVLNITVLPLNITTNTRQASCNNTHDGLITAVGNDAGPWNYTWKNASGTVVKTSLNKTTADSLAGLNNGVYRVDVSTVGTCNSATQTFTITAPSAPTSVFTAPSMVNVGANVSFTNNSTNATNYIWNFGDGNMSSSQIPTYAYNIPGTYTITLDAIIASCNDTISSTQIIQVEATTGIKQIVNGSGDIALSRDGNGNYLQFDYTNQTKVNITVYNILGQNLLNNSGLTVVNDKVYLNINDSKNQVLYVTITNLINNQQITKKFVND